MFKRRMLAAGVCMATVAVMSSSVAADGAVTSPKSALKLAAEDFAITFSATPKRVVLGPDGGQTKAEYRILVTNPGSIDQVDGVSFKFERGDGGRLNHFSMGGSVVREASATKTILSGRTNFDAYTPKKWGEYTKRANPGRYTIVQARVFVTEDGESTTVTVNPPPGTIKVRWVTETVLRKPSVHAGRVLIEGRALEYEGISGYGSSRNQMTGLPGTKLKVLFLRHGATEPRVVAITKTDSNGRYSVVKNLHHSGRWWVRFPGDQQMNVSRSGGYQVSAS